MGFGDDVLGGKIIHRQHFEPLPRGYATNGGINGGGRPGQQFIQGIRFFFGHSSHIAVLLILVSQHTVSLTATHGMKNMGSMFINKIIHDFKDIATTENSKQGCGWLT
jgi:hypothetical protein